MYVFPNTTENELFKPYFGRKSELSIDNNVIMWGYRVVVATKLKP